MKLSLLSAFLLVFVFSGLLGYREVAPFPQLHQYLHGLKHFAGQHLYQRPTGLKPRVYTQEGLSLNKLGADTQGLTAIQGWFRDGVKVKLISTSAELIHTWTIDYFDIWGEARHLPETIRPTSRFDFHAQGMHLYPDASLLVNVSQIGLVKLDQCGEVLWTLDRPVHHAITVEADGTIWVPANRLLADIDPSLVFHHARDEISEPDEASAYENLVLQIDAKGKVLREYSVLQALLDEGLEQHLFDALAIDPANPSHVNDVEVLDEKAASKFAGVRAGDLLLSLRNMHLLLVMSRDTGEIVWYESGPWVRQHDPDITKAGTISIYNNRSPLLRKPDEKPYSNILEYDPATEKLRVIYPSQSSGSTQDTPFFSSFMGTHQWLPNGHLLITESTRGRVFEVNSEGEAVWEYIEAYDDDYAALFADARRYPEDYFTVTDWSCP